MAAAAATTTSGGTNKAKQTEGEEPSGEFKLELGTYNAIRNLRVVYEPEIKERLTTEIEDKLGAIKRGMQKDLQELGKTEGAKRAVRLKARNSLLGLCFLNMLEIQPDKETAKIWQNIKLAHDQIVDDLLDICLGMKPDLERSLGWYKKELDTMKKEMADTLEMSQKLNDELQAVTREKEEMAARFEKERTELLALGNSSTIRMSPAKETIAAPAQRPVASPYSYQSAVVESQSRPKPKEQVSQQLSREPKGVTPKRPKMEGKALTLKQLKDVIADIYTQKRKYDQKCMDNRLPKETMEQYMYTYLNQQYGLKNLILDWAKSILEALARYTPTDSEVALFGKVLRNECEEGFQPTFGQAREAIMETIKDLIRRRNKYMIESEVARRLEEMGRNPVGEEVWGELLARVCSPGDLEVVQTKVREKVQERKGVDFSELMNLLLEYTLAKHELQIRKFVGLFRKIDSDVNGIINENEFRCLISLMNISINPALVDKLLSLLDPFKSQQITFSDCLMIFETVR